MSGDQFAGGEAAAAAHRRRRSSSAIGGGLGGVEPATGRWSTSAIVEGMRWGEVAGLRVGQLDFRARTLTVRETVVRGRRGAIGFGEPKTAAGRRTLARPGGAGGDGRRSHGGEGLTVDDGGAAVHSAGRGFAALLQLGPSAWYPAAVAAGVGRMVEDEATGRDRYAGLGFHDLRRANADGPRRGGRRHQDGAGDARSLRGPADARGSTPRRWRGCCGVDGRPVPGPTAARWTRDAV